MMPQSVPLNVRSVILHDALFRDSIDFSDPGWVNVTYLSINPGGSDSKTPLERQVSLHEDEFMRLKNLKHLQIACSCLREVSANTFHGLDKLNVLDLSNNILTPDSYVNALAGYNNLPNLKELYLSNTDTSFGGVFAMDTDFLDAVRNKSLKVLDISQTSYAFPRKDEDLFIAFSSLENLNLSRAGVAMGYLLEATTALDLTFPGFPKLKSIDMSYPPLSLEIARFTFGTSKVSRGYGHIAESLTEFHCRHAITLPTSIYYREFKINAKDRHVCGLFVSADSEQFEFCISSVEFNLEKVDLAENSILYFDPKILAYMTPLMFLDFSSNLLGDAFASDGYVKQTVANLYKLEVFIVHSNGIYSIPEDAFESGEILKVLDLSNNKLETIMFKTDNLVSLQRLDLSNNKISILDGISLDRLKHLKLIRENNTFVDEHLKIEIGMNGNPVKCEKCENWHYFAWVLALNETANCIKNENETFIDEYVLRDVEFDCKKSIMIGAYVALVLVEVIITSLFVYRIVKERRLKAIQDGIKGYSRQNKSTPPVFLSFCCEDDEVVMTDIAPKLEDGLQKLLQTDNKCVATGYNDFRPGLPLANEIIRCVENAKVVIFFVTNTFCKKQWCKNEAQVAHNGNKHIILMIWEELDLKQMPKYLYYHYRKHARVHWVLENGERVMKPDMDKLCEAIVTLFKD